MPIKIFSIFFSFYITLLKYVWKNFMAMIFRTAEHSKNHTGIVLGLGSASGRGRYILTSYLIGWVHTQNDLLEIVRRLQCQWSNHEGYG